MGKIVYYVAMSADGFIADDKGGVEWLNAMSAEGQDFGYAAFYATVTAVVLGSATYEQVLGFGAYPYKGVESVVMTSRTLPQPDGATVRFSQEPLSDVLRELKARHEGVVWLVGGGKLAASAQDAGLIDELDLYIMPTFLRKGIPVLAEANATAVQGLSLVSHQVFSNGVVNLRYR